MASALRKLKEDRPRALLGVERSARGFVWRDRLAPEQSNTALAMSQQHGLPELLGRILAARGIALDEVPVALAPTIKALMPDPSTLVAMDQTAARLADAIQKGEKIAVFGDYDVDGACSCALMQRFLRAHGREARIYIPDRIFEGYGPNPAAIETLVKEGAKLIVTVDCGVTSFDALAHAGKLGAEVLVIDHHQADARLPDVHAVVNPNRQDDLSGLGHLCAAGVVFMTLVATMRELRTRGAYKSGVPLDLLSLLDLVALATVADVVPLRTLNRAFVSRGLEIMRRRENLGIRALLDAARLSQAPTPYHLGFILGPRINAGGRIGDAALGARLLATEDEAEAAKIAATLERLNGERKAIESQMLEEAKAAGDNLIEEHPDLPIVVVGSQDWHKGVVGLVASRLVERFGRPSCVIAWEGKDEGTGSLRSIAGVDIGSAVRQCVSEGLLIKGGGHAMAAGLTVAKAQFDAVRARLEGLLSDRTSAARSATSLEIDGALLPSAVGDELMELLDKAGPYGQGNPQPRFVFPSHRVKFTKIMGEAHVRCTLEAGDGSRLDAVAFRSVGQPVGEMLLGSGGMPLHVVGNLRRDSWGGRERTELMIEDVADPRQTG
ncbi:MAG: single-stranded-DNA-specific exonuclease RecJ [Hyphomicrobiaceae bacterium]